MFRLGLDLPAQQRVFAAFFLYAFALGGLYPRLPELQQQLGVGEGALGMALIGVSTGTLFMLTFGARLLERLGYRRVLFIFLPLLPLWYALASHASGPLAMFLWLLPAGLSVGAVEIVVNVEADRVEHALGRRIMNRAHAFWSFGFFGAGMVAALMSWLSISPQWHLALVVPLVCVAMVLVLGRYEPAGERPGADTDAPPRFAWPTPAIALLVLLSISAMLMEGASIDWSGIYMRDEFGATATLSALAVATGALAQGIARYVADPWVERYGPRRSAQVLLAVMGAGVVLMLVAPVMPLAFLGLIMIGVGSSVIFPLAMSAAAQRTDRPASLNVAALAQTAFLAFLLGPPLLGWVAEWAGIRWAFGVGLPLIVLSLWACRGLARR